MAALCALAMLFVLVPLLGTSERAAVQAIAAAVFCGVMAYVIVSIRKADR